MQSNFVAATAVVVALGGFGLADAAHARDTISIVGSSTVFPYTQAVAEEFAKRGGKAPTVESTGTGGGMKIFCKGIGAKHPDITGASRAMKGSEYKLCMKNGVTDITEVLIGYDGLSVANSRKGKALNMMKKDLYMALAAKIYKGGKFVKNTSKTWSQVSKKLPNQKIIVYGPPPTSGTRDAFVELVFHSVCKKLGVAKKAIKKNCTAMRTDGPFIEAGENDNLIVQRLSADPNALGIFGYSFLFENSDKLQAVKIGGVTPSSKTIGDGSYGISRPLYFYIKNAHRKVIKGMNEFIKEYVSSKAMAKDGYLTERGLVPLAGKQLKSVQNAALKGTKLKK